MTLGKLKIKLPTKHDSHPKKKTNLIFKLKKARLLLRSKLAFYKNR
jgi:hypothetical protein